MKSRLGDKVAEARIRKAAALFYKVLALVYKVGKLRLRRWLVSDTLIPVSSLKEIMRHARDLRSRLGALSCAVGSISLPEMQACEHVAECLDLLIMRGIPLADCPLCDTTRKDASP